jgi:cyanate permease
MEDKRIVKIIAGFCVGIGVGICIFAASGQILSSILIGVGLGLCLSVAFNRS